MKHSLSIKAYLTLIMTILWVLMAQFSAPSNAQEASPTPQETLILGFPPPNWNQSYETLHKRVAQFEAETGIDVLINDYAGEPLYPERIGRGFYYTDTRHDVFYMNTDWLEGWVNLGYILPLDGQIDDQDDFYPLLLDSARVNGTLYCIPTDAATLALFYNRDWFDEAGLEYPTNDWTWADLRENIQLLSDFKGEPVGMSFDNDAIYWLPLLYQAGGTLFDFETNTWTVNSPEGLEALNFYLELEQLGNTAFEIGGTWAWTGDLINTNKIGMAIQGTWMMPSFLDEDLDIHWGAVELPSHRAESTLVFPNCYGIAYDTKNPEASILLANFLASPEGQSDFFWRSELPSRMSVADDFIDYWMNLAQEKGLVWHREDIRALFDSLNNGVLFQVPIEGYHHTTFINTFIDVMGQAFHGDISAEDVLNRLESLTITNEG